MRISVTYQKCNIAFQQSSFYKYLPVKRSVLLVIAISISLALSAQTPTSEEIIKTSVNYHDLESSDVL